MVNVGLVGGAEPTDVDRASCGSGNARVAGPGVKEDQDEGPELGRSGGGGGCGLRGL